MSPEITGRDLLDAAIDWYKTNGTKPIQSSEFIGANNIDSSAFYANDNYHLKSLSEHEHSKDDTISNIPSNIIPLLAGIVLGLPSKELSDIINHHNISVDSVSRLDFSSRWVDAIPTIEAQNPFLTNAKICIEMAKAFAIDPSLHEQLNKEYSGHHSGAMLLGAMHLDKEDLWPASMIDEHAQMVMSETKEFTYMRRFQGGVSEPNDISELPGGSPAELLKRSGMLTEAVLRKQTGYYDLWEDVVFEASYKREPQMEVLRYIANVADPAEIELMKRGLLSMSSDSTHHEFVPQLFYQTLEDHFGENPKFESIFNSIILKLNLIPTSEYRGGLKSMSEHQSLFDEVVNDQETLLSRVAQEILSRPGNYLGLSELRVFTKLKYAQLPPQEINFSPDELLHKVLDSWDSFVTSEKSRDRDKSDVDEQVADSIKSLVKMLSRSHNLDYEQLNHRSDNAKVLLIESGMEVRKFKGLSRRALGRVLENDMGM